MINKYLLATPWHISHLFTNVLLYEGFPLEILFSSASKYEHHFISLHKVKRSKLFRKGKQNLRFHNKR